MAKHLTRTQWWLKQHQITAFWHGFGISNGLDVPKEETKEIYTTRAGRYVDKPSPGGRTYIRINASHMRQLLKEYIKWLKSYKESWNTNIYEDSPVSNETEFIKQEGYYPIRLDIYEMIKLLQDIDNGKHLT